jgi:AcrR family transcriptional regulator
MTYDASAALRHIPKQSRGLKRVDHILRSAEALFAEVGFENSTTNAIAVRAGVSIGSLYQFFSSKEAILEAMASRYLSQTRVALEEVLSYDQSTDLGELLTKLLEMLIRQQEQRPYFLQCLGHSRPSSALTPPVLELNVATSRLVEVLLSRASVEVDPKVIRVRAQICVETIGALLPLAVDSKGRARALAVDEIKSVLERYLEPTLKVKGTV